MMNPSISLCINFKNYKIVITVHLVNSKCYNVYKCDFEAVVPTWFFSLQLQLPDNFTKSI